MPKAKTKTKDTFVSPNDMLAAGKRIMLDGREPQSEDDWVLLVNFFAANVSVAEVEICKLMRMMYNIPLPEHWVVEIAQFHIQKKSK